MNKITERKISVPSNIRYDHRLSAYEKLMYGELELHCTVNGYCDKDNKYFAELYNVTDRATGKWIKKLSELGYIKREYEYKKGTNFIIGRKITMQTSRTKV